MVAVKECVCQMSDHNVPPGAVPGFMESVLKLVGKSATSLPSKSTVNEWNIMRRSIAHQQLAEHVPDASHLGLFKR